MTPEQRALGAAAPLRIAMWSGPRNLSTALMRSFGNRADCFVTDEPLYAHYLKSTGVAHPGAAEVIATQEHDWRRVTDWLACVCVRDGAGEIVESACCDSVLSNPQCCEVIEYLNA